MSDKPIFDVTYYQTNPRIYIEKLNELPLSPKKELIKAIEIT